MTSFYRSSDTRRAHVSNTHGNNGFSPHPSKRRNSGPCMTQTPNERPLKIRTTMDNMPEKMMMLPLKTPLAPRPRQDAFWSTLPSEKLGVFKPELFLPSMDGLMDTVPSCTLLDQTPVPDLPAFVASLKPRVVPPLETFPMYWSPSNAYSTDEVNGGSTSDEASDSDSEEVLTIRKESWSGSKTTIPAVSARTLKKARSCHALCA